MKTQILNALKTKFIGVSENILGRMADKLAKTITDESNIENAVDGVTFQQLLEQYGDARANEAQLTAVKNYESKHHIKDGKPIADPNPNPADPNPADETPAWAKALIDANKALSEKVANMERDKALGSRKERLDAVIGKLPDSMKKAYSRVSLEGSDEDFDTTISEIETEVADIIKQNEQKKSLFGTPFSKVSGGNNPGEKATDAEAADVLAKMGLK